MHLSFEKIRKYLENRLQANESEQAREHLELCQFCQELLKKHKLMDEAQALSYSQPLPDNFASETKRFFLLQTKTNNVINLDRLISSEKMPLIGLAAEGAEPGVDDILNLATVYCENPEVILRIIREKNVKDDYLQIISDDPKLSGKVLVQLPELEWEVLTDENGKAAIKNLNDKKYDRLNWQIRLPEAVFELSPFTFDTHKPEFKNEFIIESDKKDLIKVTLSGDSDSKLITFEIQMINGEKEFGNLRVCLMQEEDVIIRKSNKMNIVTFENLDENKTINVRLYK